MIPVTSKIGYTQAEQPIEIDTVVSNRIICIAKFWAQRFLCFENLPRLWISAMYFTKLTLGTQCDMTKRTLMFLCYPPVK